MGLCGQIIVKHLHCLGRCDTRKVSLLLFILLLQASAILYPQIQAADPTSRSAVACLGRIIPGEGVVRVTGAYSLQGPPLVQELLVKRGDLVKQGQPLARLNQYVVSQAAVKQAEAELAWYESQVSQTRAGAKAATLAAQSAVVVRLQAEVKQAEIELRRQSALFEQKAVSQSALDNTRLNLDTTQQSLQQAEQEFSALKEVRDVDVKVAEERVRVAAAALERAKVELAQSVVLAPIDGVVFDIHTWPGERLEKEALLSLGDVSRMQVQGELHITDLPQVRVGAKASMTGEGFTGELKGELVEIGQEVQANRLFNPDPLAFTDQRVVKVWIKLDQPDRVQSLSGNLVRIKILP